MANEWDQFPDAGGTALASFNDFPDAEQKDPFAHFPDAATAYVPAEFQQADEQQAMERGELKPAPPANPIPFLEKPLVEFPHLPVTTEQSFTTRLGSAALNKIGDFVSGTTTFQGLIGLVPPVGAAQIVAQTPDLVEKVREADKTPPGSPERIDAGLDVVAAIGSLGALGAGAKAGLRPKESVRPSIEATNPEVSGVPKFPESKVEAAVPLETYPRPLEQTEAVQPRPDYSDRSASAPESILVRESQLENTLRGEPEQAPSVPEPNAKQGTPLIPNETAISSSERGTRTPETTGASETLGKSNEQAPQVTEPGTVSEPVRTAVDEPTSIKNAVTAAEREARGIAPAEEAARRDFGTVWDEATAEAQADPTASQRLVESLKDDPRALGDKENAHLLRRQIEVQNEHDAAVKAVNEAQDGASKIDAQARLDKAREDLQTVYDAAKVAGTETGRGLAARKMLANNDYSLAKMEATTRAVVNNGKALSAAQLADVKALHERIKAAEEKLSAYEAKEQFEQALKQAKAEAKQAGFKPQSFLDRQAQLARERIVARRGKLFADPIGATQIAHLADEAIIGASHIARGVTKFADWSAQMISEFGERIKPHLQALYAKARELHSKTGQRQVLTPEERQQRGLASDKKAIQTRIAKIQEKTAKGDFSKPEKQTRMDKEKADLLFEYQKAKEEYNRKLFQAKLDQQSLPTKVFRTGGEVINTARALQTSFDLSAVLRQGGIISLSHPIRALRSFPDMLRAFGSERAQHRINAEIMSRKNAPLYMKAKLFLVDESATSLAKMEEAYMSRWAGKLPGVGASQRAYITFLNKLRADSFDAMTASLGRRGNVTLPEARAIANYINIATGRGDVSLIPQAAVGLNYLFFAPRLVLSRFQFLAGQPFYRGSLRTRGLILKEYAKFLAGAGTVYALGLSAGAKLSTDRTDPDYLKLKFGNTRLDMLAGLQQATVFSAREAEAVKRFLTQQKKDPKYGSGGDVLYRFLRTKLAPAPGAVVNVITGKDVVGNRVTPKSVATDLVTPMSMGDIFKTLKEQGMPEGPALGILSLFGAGVQTYDKKKKR